MKILAKDETITKYGFLITILDKGKQQKKASQKNFSKKIYFIWL